MYLLKERMCMSFFCNNASKINLIYWEGNNFGDLLSPYIIKKISKCKVWYKYKGKRWYTELVRKILCNDIKSLTHILFPWERSLIAVGSVIAWGNKKSEVWGSGLLRSDEKVFVGKIYAVRGQFTRAQLVKQGYQVPEVYGDPAILLPWIYIPSSRESKNDVGIIPNWEETDFFQQKYGTQYKIIDLRTSDIHAIIDQIVACKYILSTSLHGIIVAHAYGVRALWIKKGDIQTDGIKFNDYFSSVNIPLYPPFINFEEILENKKKIPVFFSNNRDLSLPFKEHVVQMRKKLLNVAPFSLNEKFLRLSRFDETTA